MIEELKSGRTTSGEGGKISPSEITIGKASSPNPVQHDVETAEAALWANAGFNPVSASEGALAKRLHFVLPEGFIALLRSKDVDRKTYVDTLKAIGEIPNFFNDADTGEYTVYRLADGVRIADVSHIIPADVELIIPGKMVPLPDYNQYIAREHRAANLMDIAAITPEVLAHAAKRIGITWPLPEPDPVMTDTPLLKHSLQGQADALEKLAKAARPLLGQVCLSGQATVWYAPPNSGKTLIGLALVVRAIRENLILPDNVYYINADDNGTGLAEKLRILQDVGAHMLVPGFKKFRAGDLQGLLLEMAQSGKARGVIVIIDTIKKFASLMDKRDVSGFADTCRQFVMHGGTILAFAHTNKNTTPSGALKYAGTTDLIEDFDAAFIITPLDTDKPGDDRVVRFECIKRRGDSPDKAAYAYSTENGLSYDQLLASVEEVSFDKLGQIDRDIQQRTDAELVEAIRVCIGESITTKMQIAAEVAKRTKTSGKSVIRLIDRYTGDDPAKHHWTFTIGERGKHIFVLLSGAPPTG
jgi:hypothetical protein